MVLPMKFKEILPFARFVRYLELNINSNHSLNIPLDARIFYVVNGEGKIEVDSRIINMPTGSMICLNAGCMYRLLPSEAKYIAVNFDFTNLFSHLETPIPLIQCKSKNDIKHIEKVTFNDAPCFNEYCFLKDCHALQSKMIRLETEFVKKLPFYRQETSSILMSVLTFMARGSEKKLVGESRFDIDSIISYIQENYYKPIDNHILSEIFHFHPNYLSSEFKRCVGEPLHRYVLETRIMNAASLLESGNYSVSQVASLTGFCDNNYFTRYFKKIIGITPKQYMKNFIGR